MNNDDNKDLQALFSVASEALPDCEFKKRVMAGIVRHHKLRKAGRVAIVVLGFIYVWFLAPFAQNIPLIVNNLIFSRGMTEVASGTSDPFLQFVLVLTLALFLLITRMWRKLG